jgi:hypothetical protein
MIERYRSVQMRSSDPLGVAIAARLRSKTVVAVLPAVLSAPFGFLKAVMAFLAATAREVWGLLRDCRQRLPARSDAEEVWK